MRPQLTLQVTPAFAGSLATVAVNEPLPPASTFAAVGAMVTVSGCPEMVRVMLELTEGSVTDVAVTVTVPFVGTTTGAV